MATSVPRSPKETVGGIVLFGRVIDKIRLQASGRLPAGYNVGDAEPTWFDGRCVRFLGVSYGELRAKVLEGVSDEAALAWCFERGRKPNAEEILIWNTFMKKRGWNDEASKGLEEAKARAGLAHRSDLVTFFDLHDADEGRL